MATTHEHEWHLLEVEFEDGLATRVFECLTCGTPRLD